MHIAEADRELIERTLDVLALRLASGADPTQDELRLLHRAKNIVRERPGGAKRIRRDFGVRKGRRRSAVQPELSGLDVQA